MVITWQDAHAPDLAHEALDQREATLEPQTSVQPGPALEVLVLVLGRGIVAPNIPLGGEEGRGELHAASLH